MNIDEGGSAFPTSFNADYPTEIVGGLTTRDYFAARAMQGAIPTRPNGYEMDTLKMATWAYSMADAMLKARAK